MNSVGKKARKRHGTRFAAKQAKSGREGQRKSFGKLPVSNSRGNAQAFVLANTGTAVVEEVSE